MNPGANILYDDDNSLDVFDEFTIILGCVNDKDTTVTPFTLHITATNLEQAKVVALEYVNRSGDVCYSLGVNCWIAAAFYGHMENLID